MANDRVTPRLPKITLAYLRDLKNTGLYGASVDGVARALIEQGIRKAIADRHITPKKTNSETGNGD